MCKWTAGRMDGCRSLHDDDDDDDALATSVSSLRRIPADKLIRTMASPIGDQLRLGLRRLGDVYSLDVNGTVAL